MYTHPEWWSCKALVLEDETESEEKRKKEKDSSFLLCDDRSKKAKPDNEGEWREGEKSGFPLWATSHFPLSSIYSVSREIILRPVGTNPLWSRKK